MTATRQVYTIPASATGAQVAAVLKQLLIDAGLMTDWFDRVESADGWVHGILQLQNDAAKQYGSQYIWFACGGGSEGIYLHLNSKWSAISHGPSGTEFFDWGSAMDTSSYPGTGWWCLSTSSGGSSLIRYTSGDGRTTHIVDDQGGYPVTILKDIGEVPGWLDLDHTCAFSVFCLEGDSSSGFWGTYAGFNWYMPGSIKRCWMNGDCHRDTAELMKRYYGPMWVFNGTGVYWNAIPLPNEAVSFRPTRSSDYFPIITDINIFPPLDMRLGEDFGLVCKPGVELSEGDTLTVSPSEVWTVATFMGDATYGAALVARTV